MPVEANGIRFETIATSSCETLDASGRNRAIAISLLTAEPQEPSDRTVENKAKTLSCALRQCGCRYSVITLKLEVTCEVQLPQKLR